MEGLNKIKWGRRPVAIDEELILSVVSTCLARMTEARVLRWLTANQIMRAQLIGWDLNRMFPGVEIYFRHRDYLNLALERGVRVGNNLRHAIAPQGLKTLVKAKLLAGGVTQDKIDLVLTKTRPYGALVHHRHEQSRIIMIMVIETNIPRELVPGFLITHGGQPLECYFCKNTHLAKDCPLKCPCGLGKLHLQERCALRAKPHEVDNILEAGDDHPFGSGSEDEIELQLTGLDLDTQGAVSPEASAASGEMPLEMTLTELDK